MAASAANTCKVCARPPAPRSDAVAASVSTSAYNQVKLTFKAPALTGGSSEWAMPPPLLPPLLPMLCWDAPCLLLGWECWTWSALQRQPGCTAGHTNACTSTRLRPAAPPPPRAAATTSCQVSITEVDGTGKPVAAGKVYTKSGLAWPAGTATATHTFKTGTSGVGPLCGKRWRAAARCAGAPPQSFMNACCWACCRGRPLPGAGWIGVPGMPRLLSRRERRLHAAPDPSPPCRYVNAAGTGAWSTTAAVAQHGPCYTPPAARTDGTALTVAAVGNTGIRVTVAAPLSNGGTSEPGPAGRRASQRPAVVASGAARPPRLHAGSASLARPLGAPCRNSRRHEAWQAVPVP